MTFRTFAIIPAVIILVASAVFSLFAYFGSTARPLDFSDLDKTAPLQLKDVFDRRIKLYADDSAALASNLQIQGILIVFAVLMIYKPLQAVNIKALGLEIPAILLQCFIPAAILYTWLRFGYILHDMIENRLILWEIIPKVYPSGLAGNSVFNAQRLLRDQFFLDEYFLAFHPARAGFSEGNMGPFNRAILVCFGLFLGIGHGCMGATISNIFEEVPGGRRWHIWLFMYTLLISLALFFSHCQFYFSGPHQNWLQFVILWSAVLFTLILPDMKARTRAFDTQSRRATKILVGK